MTESGPKSHATWSASATTRNWACAGALALNQQVAHLEKESEAAGWGTACHSVAEDCLKSGCDAIEWVGRIVKSKEHTFEVDDEMAETAQAYVDYVRDRLAAYKAETGEDAVLYVEQTFSLEKLEPPFDAGGTGDAVMYFPAWALLEIVDLKGGRGVKVSVAENKQLRTYGLGAVLTNPGLNVQRVRSTIVQPRMGDGKPKSEEYHIADLVEWTGELRMKMAQSAEALAAYRQITGDLSREAWAEKYLCAGDHCGTTFCKAQGICPALEKRALDAAGVWFDDQNTPHLSNTPSDLSPERLSVVLDAADMIQNYLNACRSLAHALVESGVEVPNYILVEKTGRRKFIEDDEAVLVHQIKALTQLSDDDLYNQKLKSPSQLEKTLKKDKGLIAALIETPITGVNLVRADKTTREPVKSKADKFFQPID